MHSMQDDFLLSLHALLIRDKLGSIYTLATHYQQNINLGMNIIQKKKEQTDHVCTSSGISYTKVTWWEIFAGFSPSWHVEVCNGLI